MQLTQHERQLRHGAAELSRERRRAQVSQWPPRYGATDGPGERAVSADREDLWHGNDRCDGSHDRGLPGEAGTVTAPGDPEVEISDPPHVVVVARYELGVAAEVKRQPGADAFEPPRGREQVPRRERVESLDTGIEAVMFRFGGHRVRLAWCSPRRQVAAGGHGGDGPPPRGGGFTRIVS